jgi:hypothetical protein
MTTALFRALAGALLLGLLAGCATTNLGTPGDPLERMNRATHRFNDAVDKAVLKPVAIGYRDHVPQPIRMGINNFLDNLAFTTTIANDLLQLKLKDTLVDLGRFAVNTTIGIAGIFDPATHFGIPRNDEDFGQTLGRREDGFAHRHLLGLDDRVGTRRTLARQPPRGAPAVRYVRGLGIRPLRVRARCLAAAARIPGEGWQCPGQHPG